MRVLLSLPPELIFEIGSYLTLPHRRNFRRVCRRIRTILTNLRVKRERKVLLVADLVSASFEQNCPALSVGLSNPGQVQLPADDKFSHLSHLHLHAVEAVRILNVQIPNVPSFSCQGLELQSVATVPLGFPPDLHTFVVQQFQPPYDGRTQDVFWPVLFRPLEEGKLHQNMRHLSVPAREVPLQVLIDLTAYLPRLQTLFMFNPRQNTSLRSTVNVLDATTDWAHYLKPLSRLQFLEELALPLSLGRKTFDGKTQPSPEVAKRAGNILFTGAFPRRRDARDSVDLILPYLRHATVFDADVAAYADQLSRHCPRLRFTGWLAPDGPDTNQEFGIVMSLRTVYQEEGRATNWKVRVARREEDWEGWPYMEPDLLFETAPMA
ncbi:hypothetical protein SISSUDRAFT_1052494 [Sistotremastrum suecicum HHB10207 ss-3]|uniref:F-box domain-containing protein n=1 Tax=Sistotremastrum suecicum HHB10207 ss-3 TaxID=1314776 RepID=A0A165ZUF5_9AGAM|nr:hypothetical protein SISSUDRAFT_1052494 [Sistotremastrum suecicum HHB10207 ss-3]